MPTNVLLVHGYSVRSFDSYGLLPQLLRNAGYGAQHIYLSAFDSLNDDITCDDLALALEARVHALEAAGLQIGDTAVITHSTGAIITRRWLLNRWVRGAALPSHFISLAGANHGSTLAQLGETQLAHLARAITEGTSVGLEVLQDLDYGSEFLLRLNEEWLDAHLSNAPPQLLSFSLIGDDHSALMNQIFWQTHESGSDGTVRISGGNLNYRIASINQTAANPTLTLKQLPYRVPHLVIPNVSHTGDTGILGGQAPTMNVVFPAIRDALQTSRASYAALADRWRTLTDDWSRQMPDDCNSTIVFDLKHPGGRNIKDSLILISDHGTQAGDVQGFLNVKDSIETRQPIQNDVTKSSISFYVNYSRFSQSYPHTVQIQINSGSDEIDYPVAEYPVAAGQDGSINPNEFLYVKVTLDRDARGTLVLIPASANPDVHKTWPPLPQYP